MKKYTYTDKEDLILIKYFPDYGKKYCSDILGISECSIHHRARRLKLRASKKRIEQSNKKKGLANKDKKRPEHSIKMRQNYLKKGYTYLNNKIHGLSKHPAYRTWIGMMNRCYNNKNTSFNNYGGRGISVYKEWHKIENFVKWYDSLNIDKTNLSIERKNVDGNYTSENCIFATAKQQARNKRNTILNEKIVTEIRNIYNIGSMNQREIAKKFGLNYRLVNMVILNKIWM